MPVFIRPWASAPSGVMPEHWPKRPLAPWRGRPTPSRRRLEDLPAGRARRSGRSRVLGVPRLPRASQAARADHGLGSWWPQPGLLVELVPCQPANLFVRVVSCAAVLVRPLLPLEGPHGRDSRACVRKAPGVRGHSGTLAQARAHSIREVRDANYAIAAVMVGTIVITWALGRIFGASTIRSRSCG